jgi:hypothetical protein
MQRVERVWHRRLRWRLRGAWQWPAFVALTLADGIVLTVLPFYSGGPDWVLGGVLLAGFLNLLVVAVLAPALGRLVRRRRPDLPRLVASDYAGAWLLSAIFVGLVVGGLLHRGAAAAESDDEQAVGVAVQRYVAAHAPQYAGSLDAIDARRLESDYYRACVPSGDERRWLCLFVKTDRRPVALVPDPDRTGN